MGNSALQGFGYIGESRGYVFDSTTLTWVAMTASAAGAASTQVSVREIQTSSGASVMDSTEGAIKVNVVAGSAAGDTTATVTAAAGSTFFTMPKSTAWASSAGFHFDSSGGLIAAQNNTGWSISAISTVQGRVGVGPHDTNWASSAGLHIDSTGQLLAAPLRASTSARASLTQSSTSVTAQSANAARLQWTAINMPTQNARVFLKFGATASTTDFDVYVMPGERYEMPWPIYTGRIDAIWESTGTGYLRTTEWLA